MNETPVAEVKPTAPLPPPPPAVVVENAPVPLTAAPVVAEAAPEEVRVKRKYTKRAVKAVKAVAAPKKSKKAKHTMKRSVGRPAKKMKAGKAARKTKRVAGIKAQTQIPKTWMKAFKARSKELTVSRGETVRIADVLREGLGSLAKKLGVEVAA